MRQHGTACTCMKSSGRQLGTGTGLTGAWPLIDPIAEAWLLLEHQVQQEAVCMCVYMCLIPRVMAACVIEH